MYYVKLKSLIPVVQTKVMFFNMCVYPLLFKAVTIGIKD